MFKHPNGGGLTRPWETETARTKTDVFGSTLYKSAADSERSIVEQVAAVAEERGVPSAQIAVAWITQKSVVTAPIVGRTSHMQSPATHRLRSHAGPFS